MQLFNQLLSILKQFIMPRKHFILVPNKFKMIEATLNDLLMMLKEKSSYIVVTEKISTVTKNLDFFNMMKFI